ncbi:MAG: ATP phosphoribosyltransferase regulatory subunit [Lawsonibacter sp.]|jgi:ATP phosphoribosyltransferase regulatory subunit
MLKEQLNQLYEEYGYRKFRMSKFEDYDLYAQNKDFLKKGHIITFTDGDGSLKALKPDITLSIMKNNSGDSEKVYYNENVYRETGGTFREILQVGVESVGQIDPYAEAEVIVLAAKSLRTISEDYVLDLSDVSFVGGLLDCMGLTGIRRERVLALLAQKNVPGIQAMAGQGELQRRDADDLVQLMEIYAPLKEGIAQAGALARNNASWEALRQLSVTASILESFGLNGQVRLDFSLVNSMDYYNGVIFQGFLPKIPFPVLSGGRYDNLPRKMGKEVGAIGFALYMGRLEQFFGQERQYDADVLLTYGPDADLVKLAAFAERLRQEGRSVRCERETGQPCPVRCRKKVRYTDGIGPEEVLT